MGKDWDRLDWGGNEVDAMTAMQRQQNSHRIWLAEVYRVLKPGGTVKAFSGTRTFHRMAAAMEEAGFILGPSESLEAWMYGCLSEDSEILTEQGWVPGPQVEVGDRVACWDSDTGAITLQPVQDVTRAPYEGEMVCFRNDNTDQLLTPNHRVYKRSRVRKMVDGVRVSSEPEHWEVAEASEINRWNNLRLPLAGIHDGKGIGGEEWAKLLAWIWTEGGFDQSGTGVRIYQSSVNMEHVEEIQALVSQFAPGHKLYTRDRTYKDRMYTEYTWFFTGEVALKVRETLPEKRPTWSLLWSMTQGEKHAFVGAALRGDGSCSKGRWAFYQKHPDDLLWFQTAAHLMNRQGRINPRKKVVGLHMNPTTQLQARHLKVASEPYSGLVWCVKVPTGAFLARRSGKVFITGNSGFPKSHNVAVYLDRMLTEGKSREIKRKGVGNLNGRFADAMEGFVSQSKDHQIKTEEAARWIGWGTALKPSFEPVIVGRKPA